MRANPVKLSICVPTLFGREATFDALMKDLALQIERANALDEVEVLTDKDDGTMTIGEKRNRLLQRAKGEFIVSIDDDDQIHPQYIALILQVLSENPGIDCIGLRGEQIFSCGARQFFVYSAQYGEYWTKNGVITRPPHHLNPIRRSIALAYPYEAVRAHEDADVAMRMARSRSLRNEVMIDAVLYTYQSRRNFAWHRLLEYTEVVRHPMMIKTVNLIRLRRGVRNLKDEFGARIARLSR